MEGASRRVSSHGSSSWPDTSTPACRTYVVDKVAEALNTRRKAVNGSNLLIAGVAYKKDIDDMRESPAMDVMGLLLARGAKISYADPWVAEVHGREWSGGYDLKAVEMKSGSIKQDRLRGDRHRPQGV